MVGLKLWFLIPDGTTMSVHILFAGDTSSFFSPGVIIYDIAFAFLTILSDLAHVSL